MGYYTFVGLIIFIVSLSTAMFVYFKGPRKKINIYYSLFSVAVAVYGFGFYTQALAKTPAQEIIAIRIILLGTIFIPIFFLLSVYALLDEKISFAIICSIYSTGIIFTFINFFTSHFAQNPIPKLGFSYLFQAGPLYPLIAIEYAIGLWISLYKTFRSYQISAGIKRNQLKYLFWAGLIGFTGGSVGFALGYNVNLYPLNPFSSYCVPFAIIIIAYAIVRHQLLEIEVIIRKTLVFASLFAIVFGIFVGITLALQQFIVGGGLLGLAISSIIIIFAVRPLEDFLTRVTDKYLFQRKYDYKQILRSFIDEVITELNLDRIINSTIELLDKTLHPAATAMLLLNKYEDRYMSYKTTGYGRDIALGSSSKIATLLKATKEIFPVHQFEKYVNPTDELKREMEGLNAELAIPLMLHNDLIGIMILGKKKSDEEYTKEDLDILTDLARTEAIAVGNAQLFAEAAQNERRAAIGTLAAGINHEVGNPLNIINTKMQVYLMSLDGGLYKNKKTDEIINESKDIMNTCLKQTARISDITKKLSNFARPSKEFKPELTDIEEQIDDTLSVVGHELELERIEIKKNIQKPLSRISADKRQIQQIFFNIIKNAAQAIKEKGTIEIRAYAGSENNSDNIVIEIADSGDGIPEDKLEMIYEPFYTTKEAGKGTGLGLSIVRQLVWRNKGDIKVRSKVGEGTTFVLTFPKAA